MKKCDQDGCCEHLAKRITDKNRGFRAVHAVKLDGKPSRFVGVAYKMNADDRGLMLNWCPFCGGEPGDFKRTHHKKAMEGNA